MSDKPGLHHWVLAVVLILVMLTAEFIFDSCVDTPCNVRANVQGTPECRCPNAAEIANPVLNIKGAATYCVVTALIAVVWSVVHTISFESRAQWFRHAKLEGIDANMGIVHEHAPELSRNTDTDPETNDWKQKDSDSVRCNFRSPPGLPPPDWMLKLERTCPASEVNIAEETPLASILPSLEEEDSKLLEKQVPEQPLAVPASDLPSRGAALHAMGTCTPCHFFSTSRGCNWGGNCGFCHRSHLKVPRVRPSKTKRERARRLVQSLDLDEPKVLCSVTEGMPPLVRGYIKEVLCARLKGH